MDDFVVECVSGMFDASSIGTASGAVVGSDEGERSAASDEAWGWLDFSFLRGLMPKEDWDESKLLVKVRY